MTYKLVKLETLSEDYKKEHAGDEAGQSCRVIQGLCKVILLSKNLS